MRKHILTTAAVAAALCLTGCSKKTLQETAPETTAKSDVMPDARPPVSAYPRKAAYAALTDERDGQQYRTTQIGGQVWMAENLNYAPENGNSWCYMDDKSYCGKYGRLYDWTTARTVCPAGWHLPTAQEWDELTGWVNFTVGGNTAVNLAAANIWDNERETEDDYGFSALPGGVRDPKGKFYNADYLGNWWTDTEEDGNYAYKRIIRRNNDNMAADSERKNSGNSVRCVKDEGKSAVSYSLTIKAANGGTAAVYPKKTSYNAGKRVTITATPKSGYLFDKWTGGETENDTSATTAVIMNSDMTITANFRPILYGTLSDTRDGRTYKTVKMPDGMIWMAENLNYAPSKGNGWVYMNNTSYSDKYGRLYDWETAKEVCPEGWRLPTRREWNRLGEAVGGEPKQDKDGNINWRGAGRKLKATSGWGENDRKHRQKGNWNGSDDYGFSALSGGGLCGAECYGGGYYGAGDHSTLSDEYATWWTATDVGNGRKAFYRRIFLHSAYLNENLYYKSDGYSVRCVTGAEGFVTTTAPATYSLTVKAANGGTVSVNPVKTAYTAGETVSISASPICGYAFSEWTDGETADATSSTTTVTVNSNLTVTAKFTRVTPYIAHGSFTDKRDGKTYKTVQICKDVWMAENLNYKTDEIKCSDDIDYECKEYDDKCRNESKSDCKNFGSRCYDDKDSSCKKYGRLYDWETATKVCPSGWHLASDKEWEELEGYAEGWEREVGKWRVGGKRLKTKIGWKKYEGKDGGEGTDDFGFSALPGGVYSQKKGFSQIGEVAGWWTATNYNDGKSAYRRYIVFNGNSLQSYPYNRSLGFSARCVSDKEGRVPAPAALTLKLIAATGGTVSANPNKASYVAGERVTISTVPNRGYTFAKWTGGKVADTGYAVAIVTVNSNTAITANFNKRKAPPVVYGSLNDTRDGKKYETVSIGGRVWMAQNLNYETPDSSWCYGDSAGNCGRYGRLYAWNMARTVCPTGWHLPTAQEWDDLVNAAGGAKTAGNKLKATSGWTFFGSGWVRTGNGTDDYGFSALPGGKRAGDAFHYINQYGYWWTATEDEKDVEKAYYRKIEEYKGEVKWGEWGDKIKSSGMSVRCVVDEAAPYSLTLIAANGGTVSANPNKVSYKAGERVAISAVPNNGYAFAGWTGGRTANADYAATTVTVDSNITITANFKKSDAPSVAYGTLSDARDGKKYKTVAIGGKTWTAENLSYQTPENSWCYDDKTENCVKYGRLYEWETAKKACPAGWHLPTRDEWNDLISAAGGENAAHKRLKSISGWSRTGNGTDVYGFSALPGGYRNHLGRRAKLEFEEAGNEGYWWTATEGEFISSRLGAFVGMASDSVNVFGDAYYKSGGLSARCVMNEDGVLTLIAATGGTVSANPNKVSYKAGEQVTISAVPGDGYAFTEWTGGAVADVNAATTTVAVNADMTIFANFRRIVSGTLSDTRDGKTYKTAKIGRKTWMAENLNYKTDDGSWCYQNDAAYCDKYGRLYDWKTAKKACPTGWHLPTRAEWDSLAVTAGGWCHNQPYNNDIGITWYEAGKKLKSKTDWGQGVSERGGNGTDNFGFSAMPGGFRDGGSSGKSERFGLAGSVGFWWSSAQRIIRGDGFFKPVTQKDSSSAYMREMDNILDVFGEHDRDKSHGYSVRCVMDK
jgi:uncharacterized protein (TIGR02145 family)/uncharacterized repeat protein (TIGR02543 family)